MFIISNRSVEVLTIKKRWKQLSAFVDLTGSPYLKMLKIWKTDKHIYVYTDCQTIIDLYEKRKKKLLDNNFRKKNGELLEHANLYREFFSLTDNYVLHFKKIKGHSPKQNKNLVPDLIFSIIDSFSRKKMRSVVNKPCWWKNKYTK